MLLPQAHLHVHAAAPVDNDFVLTVETTSPNETFVFTCNNVGVYNANIDWGDGNQSTITAFNDPDLSHVYVDAGVHTVTISGSFPALAMNNISPYRLMLKSVENWGDVGFKSLKSLFWGCENVEINATDSVKGVLVEPSLSRTFSSCFTMTNLDMSEVDLTVCDEFTFMFTQSDSLSSLQMPTNTDSATGFYRMFWQADSLDPGFAGGFNYAGVNAVHGMFWETSLSDIDFSGANMANVMSFEDLFRGSPNANPNFDGVPFPNITSTSRMFLTNAAAMTTQNVDNFLKAIYDERMNFGWSSPNVDIAQCQTPSGVYQDPGGIPTTGLEYVYVLENDPNAEGFNTWSITY